MHIKSYADLLLIYCCCAPRIQFVQNQSFGNCGLNGFFKDIKVNLVYKQSTSAMEGIHLL